MRYQAGFKKSKWAKLEWLTVEAASWTDARRKLAMLAAEKLPGYRMHGGPVRVLRATRKGENG